MMAVLEEERNVAELKRALELFNANAERLYSTHEALRKRVQELTAEAQDLRSRLQNVLASTTDALVVIDASLRVTLANSAAREMGFAEGMVFRSDRSDDVLKEGGVAGVHHMDATAASDIDHIDAALIRELTAGRAVKAREYTLRTRGEPRVFSVSAAPLISAEKKDLAGIVMSFRDVTEIHRLRADLSRRERLAVLGEMAAVIAHEVRNPLGGLRLYAGLARDALDKADVKSAAEYITSISGGIDEIDATIESVLTFAKDMEARFAPTILASVVEEAAGLVNGLFSGRAVTFESRIPDDLVVNIDARLMRRAVANLIDNAVKMQPAGGKVEVWHEVVEKAEQPPLAADSGVGAVLPSDKRLAIVVGDRGPGVRPEEAEGWFEPFRTGRAEGTGLGLAIVERIADAHGGSAKLRPRSGGGTEAVIFLPAGLIVEQPPPAVEEHV